MIPYSFHPAAEAEALEAADFYETRVRGLAGQFRLELNAAIQFLQRHPTATPSEGNEKRRKHLNRFPYSLIYAVEAGEIRIYAVVHDRRRPGYWWHRVP